MSNKNRAVVKDGRLQVKKKRTDRSYLQPTTAPEPAPSEAEDESAEEPQAASVAPEVAVADPPVESEAAVVPAPDPLEAYTPPLPVPVPVSPAPATATPVAAAPRVGAARALQQQGVRKRREVDVNELARRDSSYAMHELRRIGILAVMVVVSLIVLAIVLR